MIIDRATQYCRGAHRGANLNNLRGESGLAKIPLCFGDQRRQVVEIPLDVADNNPFLLTAGLHRAHNRLSERQDKSDQHSAICPQQWCDIPSTKFAMRSLTTATNASTIEASADQP